MPLSFSISKNSFDGQLPDEKIILITRKHWFVLFCRWAVILILFFIPFLIYLFIKGFSWYPSISPLYWFLTIDYFLVLWLLLFYHLVLFLFTITVVTNKRLIKIDQTGLFQYKKSETELEKIQDIRIKIEGIFGVFLNFGDLEAQTAGAITKFDFDHLPNPQKIKEIIVNTKNSAKSLSTALTK